MPKHLIVDGLLSPKRSEDADAGFVEVTEKQSKVISDAYQNDMVLEENLSKFVTAQEGFGKSLSELPYHRRKTELAKAREAEEENRDWSKEFKDNNGQGQNL